MSKKDYLVSAIVSVYNCERFIRGCLEDLEQQTIADKLEIVVVNSGSQQNEEPIIKEFQEKYDNIAYIKTEERETIYKAWNRGIKASSGKYITNANTDDRHRKDALEVMAKVLEEERDVGLVYSDDIMTETENETFEKYTAIEYSKRNEFDRNQLLYTGYAGSHPMWRKSLHEEFGYFDETFKVAGDYEFWLRTCEKYKFKLIKEYLGLYFISPDSAEHRNFEITGLETIEIREKYIKRARNNKKWLKRLNELQSRELFDVGYSYLQKQLLSLARKQFLRSISYNWKNFKSYKCLLICCFPSKIAGFLFLRKVKNLPAEKRPAVPKIRIGYYVDNGIGLGGSAVYLKQLLSNIDHNKYKVILFCKNHYSIEDKFGPSANYEIRYFDSSDKKVKNYHSDIKAHRNNISGVLKYFWIRLPLLSMRLLFGYLRDIRKMMNILKEYKLDIFHSNDGGVDPMVIAAHLAKVPVVISTYHILPSQKNNFARRIIENISMRYLDKAILVSKATKDAWIRQTGVKGKNIEVIYNGIDLAKFKDGNTKDSLRKELNIEQEDIIISVPARLHPMKGHKYLIEAAVGIKKKFPNAKILFAGDGDLKESLKAMVKAKNLEETVRFLGHRNDMIELMFLFDIVTLPSISLEALPYVLIEAMACKKPVVASNFSGIPEVVEDSITGILVPPGDSYKLAEAIIKLLKDKTLREKMGEFGRKRVEKLFTEERMLQETFTLYEEMIARKESHSWGWMGIKEVLNKWWPASPNRDELKDSLREFYNNNSAYHKMTASSDKANNPQVSMLMSLVKRGNTYAEFGCGGGQICGLVGLKAKVQGFDISPIAVAKARNRFESVAVTFDVAEAAQCPIPANSVDGTYSFEVFEHLWDPVAALREMIRITKPGGFILVSCPNHFSLDLHLRKRPIVRFSEYILALMRYLYDRIKGTVYINLVPNIDSSEVYPDCNMITSLVPWNISRLIKKLGCSLELIDTYYMCAHKQQQAADINLQKNSKRPILRWFGDHILFLARKMPQSTSFIGCIEQSSMLKVAVIASGYEHIKRGVETWAKDLAYALKEKGIKVKLYKGSGTNNNGFERSISCVRCGSNLSKQLLKMLPRFSWRFGMGSDFQIQQTTFTLNLLPELMIKRFDVIHTQDPDCANILRIAKKIGLIRSKVILAHGTEEPFSFIKKFEYLQHLAPYHMEEAMQNGVNGATKQFTIGNFVDTERFKGEKNNLKKELSIPEDAFVVLSVAAIKKAHKRVDYLINEVNKTKAYLIIAGARTNETANLVKMGKDKLGKKIIFLTDFPRERMNEVYAIADLFVLCSLFEMFGIVFLEAMASEIPVLGHIHPIFEWVIGPGGECIDMTKEGELAKTIEKYMDENYRKERAIKAREQAVKNFSKEVVVEQIVRMYKEVLKGV